MPDDQGYGRHNNSRADIQISHSFHCQAEIIISSLFIVTIPLLPVQLSIFFISFLIFSFSLLHCLCRCCWVDSSYVIYSCFEVSFDLLRAPYFLGLGARNE